MLELRVPCLLVGAGFEGLDGHHGGDAPYDAAQLPAVHAAETTLSKLLKYNGVCIKPVFTVKKTKTTLSKLLKYNGVCIKPVFTVNMTQKPQLAQEIQ